MSADASQNLSPAAKKVLSSKRIRARSSARYFLEILSELSRFDSVTDQGLSRWKLMVKAFGLAFLIFAAAALFTYFSRGSEGSMPLDLLFLPSLIGAVLCLFALGFSFMMWRKYMGLDLMNDAFYCLYPFLSDLGKILPNANIKMDLDLAGPTNEKIAGQKKNTAESMKTIYFTDYLDPWLDMTVELEAGAYLRVKIENRLEKKKMVKTERERRWDRDNRVRVTTMVDWKKDVNVSLVMVRKRMEARPVSDAAGGPGQAAAQSPGLDSSMLNQTYTFHAQNDIPGKVAPPEDLMAMFQKLYRAAAPPRPVTR